MKINAISINRNFLIKIHNLLIKLRKLILRTRKTYLNEMIQHFKLYMIDYRTVLNKYQYFKQILRIPSFSSVFNFQLSYLLGPLLLKSKCICPKNNNFLN